MPEIAKTRNKIRKIERRIIFLVLKMHPKVNI